MKSIPIYHDNKRIGSVNEDTFTKVGMIFRILNAIGNNIEVQSQLETLNVKKIVVKIKNTNKVYETDLDNFRKFGEVYDLGYGQQIFLKLFYWKKIGG